MNGTSCRPMMLRSRSLTSPETSATGISQHGLDLRMAEADRLARTTGLDMIEAGFRPTVENYLGRVPKTRILEAIREGAGDRAADLIAHLKKGDMAEEAERLLAETGQVADQEGLVAAVLAREEQGTTGLGDEIAIPHAKTDAVTAPVVGFARSAKGIDWGSFDSTLAKLVFMISVPQSAANDEHLRILALLSQKLMDADFRAALQAAPDRAGIMAVLAKIG